MLVHVKQIKVTVHDGTASFRSVLVGMCITGHTINVTCFRVRGLTYMHMLL